jgi:hypothetical protein
MYSNSSAITKYKLGWQGRLMKFKLQTPVTQPWDARVNIGAF